MSDDDRTDTTPTTTSPAGDPLAGARQAALRRLGALASAGGLTLEEYAAHAAAVEQAGEAARIDSEVAALPSEPGAASAGGRGRGSWLVGVFGGTEQRGLWRLGRRLRVLALLGGVSLDLGAAQVEGAESSITIVAFLGGAELLAPPGIAIQLSGFSLFGGKSDERSPAAPLPGAPLIRVHAFAVFGGVKVGERKPRRGLGERVRGWRGGGGEGE